MLSIKKNKDYQNDGWSYPYNILIDGIICEGAGMFIRDVDGQYGLNVLEVENSQIIKKLQELAFSDFFEFQELNFYSWAEFDDLSLHIKIDKFHYKENQGYYTEFYIKPNFSLWKHPYSFVEYQDLFTDILVQKQPEILFFYGNNKYNEFTEIILFVYHNFSDKSIKEELKEYELDLLTIHKEVRELLKSQTLDKSLLTSFNFPEEIKTFCEQYLFYFAQFLQDLGIKATSDLKEEAGKVLFSVTPTDDVEALDKIREALAVYLNLPSSPIVYDESFAAMRLQQQVENLQHSQKMAVREIRSSERELRLAQTVIEYQDKIIIQKDSIIEQQNKVIEKITSKSIMMDSLENKEEFEKVFDGLEFGESKELKEKLGIKFNPMTSLKTLGKTLIGQADEITSLNLGEQAEEKDI